VIYAELTKSSVTTLIVMTAWCGYFFGAQKAGRSALSLGLFHALLGIGMVSSGTATLNEVLERDTDSKMRRTARRPLPAGRMSVFHATLAGLMLTLGGSIYLAHFSNVLTAALTFATAVVYLALYTPKTRVTHLYFHRRLSRRDARSTRVGGRAWPNRMGRSSVVCNPFLLAVPALFSIAWLYRDDYAQGGVRMLPVVQLVARRRIESCCTPWA
jgi:heme o synthase